MYTCKPRPGGILDPLLPSLGYALMGLILFRPVVTGYFSGSLPYFTLKEDLTLPDHQVIRPELTHKL